MGSGASQTSSSCCGRIQDCCRDTCGCCPCKCCKTVMVEVKAVAVKREATQKSEIPFGYGRIHAGIHLNDNTYTSPILEMHTWRKSTLNTQTVEGAMGQRVALAGLQTARDNADHYTKPLQDTEYQKVEVDEDVITIPIESILSIKSSSELRKEQKEHKTLIIKKPPPVKLSCLQSCCRCMNRALCCGCCCCCDDDHAQVGPSEIVTTITDKHASRKVLVTIEYIPYSHINTPSHTVVLAQDDRNEHFKAMHRVAKLSFYLVDNLDFENSDFHLCQKQAATLCRMVTQLKSMIGHYPDERTFEQIISKESNLLIGQLPTEHFRELLAPKGFDAIYEGSVRKPLPPVSNTNE